MIQFVREVKFFLITKRFIFRCIAAIFLFHIVMNDLNNFYINPSWSVTQVQLILIYYLVIALQQIFLWFDNLMYFFNNLHFYNSTFSVYGYSKRGRNFRKINF